MDILLPSATSADERARSPRIAILPVGSFEQHGAYLPLCTDTIVAGVIAKRLSDTYDLFQLPPVTMSCSHEHAAFPGTVSISARTLIAIVTDVYQSLQAADIDRLVIVNGHGGNYALRNVVQQANIPNEARMALFPTAEDWADARTAAGCGSQSHDDMHAGELEVSMLLHATPWLVRPGYETSDHLADDRRDLLTLGMGAYTTTGVIGRPSLAAASKGAAVLESLTAAFSRVIELLEPEP
ncbi:creatinine amidohydrolase [Hamadaea flava]|uniref:Creatininase family protein n=1 Tax=Hamadaea flava TaxID=1742688 RepID=A0ABV8LKF4_9ACTN|nr:creatininase family protein [Hamadaea flava]MCP2323547.1 creatinine amidohydrolase [Hamadaea flava]